MAVLGIGFFTVRVANLEHARRKIDADLNAGALVFQRLIQLRLEQLTLGASLMSDDWAFRRLYGGTEDFHDPLQRRTLLSGLENYRIRMENAAFLMLVSLDEELLIDSRGTGDETIRPFPHPALMNAAMESDDLTATVFEWIDGHPYVLLAVPILLPEPSGWIVVGFQVDDSLAEDFKKLSSLEISFVQVKGEKIEITASTLPEILRIEMGLAIQSSKVAGSSEERFHLKAGDETWVSRWSQLPGGGIDTRALLQRALSVELAPYKQLETTLLFLMFVALGISAFMAIGLARGISKPVDDLAKGVRRIESGQYLEPVPIRREDELGSLARAFNEMAVGLDERDRVRDLLGKAVSPEIASELLKRPLALGGEEREVTVLFTDLRGFTQLSETVPPTTLLEMLNEYFTHITRVIEAHGGIVDKYIGDSVMAIFGAPVTMPDHAKRAVQCCLDLCESLDEFNQDRDRNSLPPLGTGIGVATGVVVAGNMGSESRHNYTVIGDAVNLAARLQDLTKVKHTRCLIAADTADRCADAKSNLEAFGEIEVRGKAMPVTVFRLKLHPQLSAN